MRSFTHRTARKFALVGAATATGLLLTACGADDSTSGMDHGGGTSATASASASGAASGSASAAPSGSGAAAAPGAFNDADVMFAQMMIPHHEQALEMATLAEGRAEDPEVKKLVTAIEQASRSLRRVVLVTGTKYYGSHLGPFKTPARESDPRVV